MNIKEKPVKVVLKRHKRKNEDQPWTVEIQPPLRKAYDMDGRYFDDSTARRGARRNLGAVRLQVDGQWGYYWPDGRGNYHPIAYSVKRNK